MRDVFVETILSKDSEGDAQPLSNITVEVFIAGSTTEYATIYQSRSGVATGPSPITGSSGNNPFTTGDTGLVIFWCETGEYDVRFTDTEGIPRIQQIIIPFQAASPVDLAEATAVSIRIGDQIPSVNDEDSPDGRFLLADGRLLSSSAYPELDALIGESAPPAKKHRYNGGLSPAPGLFKIPDKRGRSSIGANDFGTAQGAATGNTRHLIIVGESGGEALHTLTTSELAPHVHTFPVYETTQGNLGNYAEKSSGFVGGNVGTTNWTGGGQGHNTVHPVEADAWLIRVK